VGLDETRQKQAKKWAKLQFQKQAILQFHREAKRVKSVQNGTKNDG
jgi:hypothetical protein